MRAYCTESAQLSLCSVTLFEGSFREKLHKAWDVAKAHLAGVQSKMKTRYNQKSVVRSFQPGDSVLVLLPVPGSALQASQSPWSSPCLLVPKSDSSLRFCTDYRKVNNVTKPDSFPLPRMEDCVDRVGSSRYVTKLDLLKGYWQVPLTPLASEISAFVTPDNFLNYTVMAFGMRNAPATFQRLM
ncbi:hypothetical protein QQF64_014589 [Cirrhinus molitorella]|uniref:ribonuclease H n=1 Tax=Cirrhinus molitorella TaxID=172907 RepID=A0ABR3NSJ9_9TELE